jgi:hypothetical protein
MPCPYDVILGRKLGDGNAVSLRCYFGAEIRRRQCRVPTMLFWVRTRHCLGLYIIPVQPELILNVSV